MRFIVGYGECSLVFGPKESFMLAEEDAYSNIDEEVEEWLEECFAGQYTIEPEFIPNDVAEVVLMLEFDNDEAAMAYKLRWE